MIEANFTSTVCDWNLQVNCLPPLMRGCALAAHCHSPDPRTTDALTGPAFHAPIATGTAELIQNLYKKYCHKWYNIH